MVPKMRPRSLLASKSFVPCLTTAEELRKALLLLGGELAERIEEDTGWYGRRPKNLVIHHRGVFDAPTEEKSIHRAGGAWSRRQQDSKLPRCTRTGRIPPPSAPNSTSDGSGSTMGTAGTSSGRKAPPSGTDGSGASSADASVSADALVAEALRVLEKEPGGGIPCSGIGIAATDFYTTMSGRNAISHFFQPTPSLRESSKTTKLPCKNHPTAESTQHHDQVLLGEPSDVALDTRASNITTQTSAKHSTTLTTSAKRRGPLESMFDKLARQRRKTVQNPGVFGLGEGTRLNTVPKTNANNGDSQNAAKNNTNSAVGGLLASETLNRVDDTGAAFSDIADTGTSENADVASVPGTRPQGELDADWSCVHCTFVNSKYLRTCEMCLNEYAHTPSI